MFYFISVLCSESELEELLTMYTKQNKSASIFLGTGSTQASYKSMTDITARPMSSQPRGSASSTVIHHRHNSSEGPTDDRNGDNRTKDTGRFC